MSEPAAQPSRRAHPLRHRIWEVPPESRARRRLATDRSLQITTRKPDLTAGKEDCMRLMNRALFIGAALALAACGEAAREQPATVYLDELGTHVAGFEKDLAAHASEITVAPDLAAMMVVEADHMKGVQGHMDQMNHALGEMGMCSDDQGHMMSTGMMADLLEQARGECDRHDAAMGEAPDMNTAMGEEAHHQDMMAGLMAQMMESRERMAAGEMHGGSGMHMCGMDGMGGM